MMCEYGHNWHSQRVLNTLQEVDLEVFATKYMGLALGGGHYWRGKLSKVTDLSGRNEYCATRKVEVPPGLIFYSVYRWGLSRVFITSSILYCEFEVEITLEGMEMWSHWPSTSVVPWRWAFTSWLQLHFRSQRVFDLRNLNFWIHHSWQRVCLKDDKRYRSIVICGGGENIECTALMEWGVTLLDRML